jgi:hypothetical protein
MCSPISGHNLDSASMADERPANRDRTAHRRGPGPGVQISMLKAAGDGAILAEHPSLAIRPAFPSRPIISERSSPSRVRFAAPNNDAPLTAPGGSEEHVLTRGKGSSLKGYSARGHFAAKMAPFFDVINREISTLWLGTALPTSLIRGTVTASRLRRQAAPPRPSSISVPK